MDEIDLLINNLNSPDFKARGKAVDALANHKDQRATLRLASALRDQDLSIRNRALAGLLDLGSSAIEHLIEALQSTSRITQLQAIHTLGELRDRSAAPSLIHLMESGSTELYYEIIDALIKVNDDRALDTYVSMLDYRDPEVRTLAAKGLVNIGSRAVRPLINGLKSQLWMVRYMSAETLGHIGDPLALDPLVHRVEDDDQSVACAAIVALGRLKDSKAIAPLLSMLKTGEQVRRQAVAKALTLIEDQRALQPLINSLLDENWSDRSYLIDALVALGPLNPQPLITSLRSENSLIRVGIAEVFSRLKCDDSVPSLIELLDDFNTEVRLSAISALLFQEDQKSISSLVNLLGDRNPQVQLAASEALLGYYPTSQAALVRGLCHEQRIVRSKAASLLYNKEQDQSQTHPLALPRTVTPYLMDALLYEKNLRPQLVDMIHRVQGDSLASSISLIYQGHSQTLILVDLLRQQGEWRHLSLLLEDFETLGHSFDKKTIRSIKKSLKATARNQFKAERPGICLSHLTRLVKQTHSTGIVYAGCRTCGSTIFGIDTTSLILVLDKSYRSTLSREGSNCRVNWFRIMRMIDFDRVEIGDCSDDDIQSFCVEMGNETDPFRLGQFLRSTCALLPSASLSQSTLNLLKQRFRTVHHLD